MKYLKYILPVVAILVIVIGVWNHDKSLDDTAERLMAASAVNSGTYSGQLIITTIRGNSMHPTIPAGSVIGIDPSVPLQNIRVGDIIAIHDANVSSQLPVDSVTHRVTSIAPDGLRTKGDHNPQLDPWKVTSENYRGLVVYPITE